jgi:hypothetical protein
MRRVSSQRRIILTEVTPEFVLQLHQKDLSYSGSECNKIKTDLDKVLQEMR